MVRYPSPETEELSIAHEQIQNLQDLLTEERDCPTAYTKRFESR